MLGRKIEHRIAVAHVDQTRCLDLSTNRPKVLLPNGETSIALAAVHLFNLIPVPFKDDFALEL